MDETWMAERRRVFCGNGNPAPAIDPHATSETARQMTAAMERRQMRKAYGTDVTASPMTGRPIAKGRVVTNKETGESWTETKTK